MDERPDPGREGADLTVDRAALVQEAILDTGEAVDRLAGTVEALTGYDEPADLTEVVKALVHLRAVLYHLQDTRATLAEYAYHLMPSPQVVIPGIGKVERQGGWTRKAWEHEALLAKVVEWARNDRAFYAQDHDGELPPETEGQTVVRLLQEHAGIGYWKVGATRERGVDVDEYCKREKARKGISLPREEG